MRLVWVERGVWSRDIQGRRVMRVTDPNLEFSRNERRPVYINPWFKMVEKVVYQPKKGRVDTRSKRTDLMKSGGSRVGGRRGKFPGRTVDEEGSRVEIGPARG